MVGLSAFTRNEISRILDSKYQDGFTVKYDDEKNPIVTITLSSSPEYQFVIATNNHANGFTTSERPGTRSEAAETFERSTFELCIQAIREWTERIAERQKDWMLDEFGGVADMNPSLTKSGPDKNATD